MSGSNIPFSAFRISQSCDVICVKEYLGLGIYDERGKNVVTTLITFVKLQMIYYYQCYIWQRHILPLLLPYPKYPRFSTEFYASL